MSFSLVLLRRSWSSGQRLALPLVSVPSAAAGRRQNRFVTQRKPPAGYATTRAAPGGASRCGSAAGCLNQGPPRPPAGQRLTVRPIDRAVPSMIFSAASIVVALRSGILVWAISRTCAGVTEPTFVVSGSPLPLATPAAFLSSSAAGGVLVTNENERSS